MISRMPCSVPSSPGGPCSTLSATSGLSVCSTVGDVAPDIDLGDAVALASRAPRRRPCPNAGRPRARPTSLPSGPRHACRWHTPRMPLSTNSRVNARESTRMQRILICAICATNFRLTDAASTQSDSVLFSSRPRDCVTALCADALDLPFERDAGIVLHAPAHLLAQLLDVGRRRVAAVDQEVAVQLGHLRVADDRGRGSRRRRSAARPCGRAGS